LKYLPHALYYYYYTLGLYSQTQLGSTCFAIVLLFWAALTYIATLQRVTMKFEKKKEPNFDSSLSLSQRTPKEKKKSTVDAINRS
jgi:sorbitol-specific phosphotransferase system component IIA